MQRQLTSLAKPLQQIILFAALAWQAPVLAKQYQMATGNQEVVLNKLYPKKKTIEFNSEAGAVFNQSFVNSFLIGLGATYNLSENWGFGINWHMAQNTDKDTRACVESFYNDPEEEVAAECLAQDISAEIDQAQAANLGPAYVPILVVDHITTVDAVWSPIYGKQMFAKIATNHFDLQFIGGLGVALAKFYPLHLHIRDNPDRPSRGGFPEEGNTSAVTPGAGINERDSQGLFYGEAGRPTPEALTIPTLKLAIAQRYHFRPWLSAKFELRTYSLFGRHGGPSNLFSLIGGVGVRL